MDDPAKRETARQMFPPHPTSARAARQFVAATLDGRASEETMDTACLLTSELVTNAVIHARTDIEVSVLRSHDHFRVEVGDQNTRLPALVSIPTDATTGRGLLLLAQMAAMWGVDQDALGKSVWFELAADGDRHGDDTAADSNSVRY